MQLTSATDIGVLLTEGQDRAFVTYFIHCYKIFAMLPNKHSNWDTTQIQYCMRSNRTASCEKCYVVLAFGVLPVYHTKTRFSKMKHERNLYTCQADNNKNVCTLHFSTFKNKYIGACRRTTGDVRRHLEFKCPLNPNVHFFIFQKTFSSHTDALRSLEVTESFPIYFNL
jgi:hypothetical protein